ncbi:hypothetical protein [Desulfonatronum thioautotrophicum]|uniref:hypothetical protein n=1 Tax=Desulfonatronum thioautotrophicum TaxID=617001 RepID=UPI0005EB129D|nr:hypothetical protein [Desulfonatronum thioautotrophicum]
MTEKIISDAKIQAASEKLAHDLFTPALLEATGKALQDGYDQAEILNGFLLSTAEMLSISLGGQKGAAMLLRDFATSLEQAASADKV